MLDELLTRGPGDDDEESPDGADTSDDKSADEPKDDEDTDEEN